MTNSINIKNLCKYYDRTEARETRDDLKFAASLIGKPKIAIDCGCGAGSDIAFLLEQNFLVHAFDIEQESVLRCRERFGNESNLLLTRASFRSFDYPKASLVVADASLFFCNKFEFEDIWNKLNDCLVGDGVFCGSFLGRYDSMANQEYTQDVFWHDRMAMSEVEVRDLFSNFSILRFQEHRYAGKTDLGNDHEWHIYSVVARKQMPS